MENNVVKFPKKVMAERAPDVEIIPLISVAVRTGDGKQSREIYEDDEDSREDVLYDVCGEFLDHAKPGDCLVLSVGNGAKINMKRQDA